MKAINRMKATPPALTALAGAMLLSSLGISIATIALPALARDFSAPISAVRWVILALLVFASAIAYVLRNNMSVAGKDLSADLGLSEFQLGMVLSAFAWGYAIFQFPGGVFGERIGGDAQPARTVVLRNEVSGPGAS